MTCVGCRASSSSSSSLPSSLVRRRRRTPSTVHLSPVTLSPPLKVSINDTPDVMITVHVSSDLLHRLFVLSIIRPPDDSQGVLYFTAVFHLFLPRIPNLTYRTALLPYQKDIISYILRQARKIHSYISPVTPLIYREWKSMRKLASIFNVTRRWVAPVSKRNNTSEMWKNFDSVDDSCICPTHIQCSSVEAALRTTGSFGSPNKERGKFVESSITLPRVARCRWNLVYVNALRCGEKKTLLTRDDISRCMCVVKLRTVVLAKAIYDLWLVLIAPTHEGMARLSWPGWLVTYRDKCLVPGIEPEHGRPFQ